MRNGLRRYINPRNRDPIPAMSLLFARDKALDPCVTFTRASSGTYFDASGVMQTASTDVPRFTHDPVTGQSLGLLIEESRTNLLTYSEEFDNGAWGKYNSYINQNSKISPAGDVTADKIFANTVNAKHSVYKGLLGGAGTYTLSFYLSLGEYNTAQIYLYDNGFRGQVTVRLDTGTINVLNGTGSIEHVGDGVYRVSTTGTMSGVFEIGCYIGNDGSVTDFVGDGTSGIYIWGAQLEQGSFPTSYIKTTSSTATRAVDVPLILGNDFATWFNATEGTFVVEAMVSSAPSRAIFSVTQNSITNRIIIAQNAALTNSAICTVAGVNVAALTKSALTPGVVAKHAFSYKQNQFAYSRNGDSPLTDSAGSIPDVLGMCIGGTLISNSNSGPINSTIASIAYYPTRLSNSYLQYLTS